MWFVFCLEAFVTILTSRPPVIKAKWKLNKNTFCNCQLCFLGCDATNQSCERWKNERWHFVQILGRATEWESARTSHPLVLVLWLILSFYSLSSSPKTSLPAGTWAIQWDIDADKRPCFIWQTSTSHSCKKSLQVYYQTPECCFLSWTTWCFNSSLFAQENNKQRKQSHGT